MITRSKLKALTLEEVRMRGAISVHQLVKNMDQYIAMACLDVAQFHSLLNDMLDARKGNLTLNQRQQVTLSSDACAECGHRWDCHLEPGVCSERAPGVGDEQNTFCCCEMKEHPGYPIRPSDHPVHYDGGQPQTQRSLSERPTWPETWMSVAKLIASRSYDPRLKVGAIIVSSDNTQVLSVGYNGNYMGGPHEHESSEPGHSGFIHAEINALLKVDYNFPKQKHMYITHSPCRMCSKCMINGGIKQLVYNELYRDTSGLELLVASGVKVLSLEEAIRSSQQDT